MTATAADWVAADAEAAAAHIIRDKDKISKTMDPPPPTFTLAELRAAGPASRLLPAAEGRKLDKRGRLHASAFKGDHTLTNLVLPCGVNTIGDGKWLSRDGAFRGCCNLVSITLPDSLISIGALAFYGCKKLTTITLPESLTSIGSAAFADCCSLTAISFPETLTTIDDRAFDGCTNLVTITLPDSLTSLGNRAFSGCSRLTTITLSPASAIVSGPPRWPNGGARRKNDVQAPPLPIGGDAFKDCTRLQTLIVPDSVAAVAIAAAHPGTNRRTAEEVAWFWKTLPSTNLSSVVRINAPDHIAAQLGGRFKEFSTVAKMPRHMQAALHATTVAGVELWLWWSSPQPGGPPAYYNPTAPTHTRRVLVWTAMLIATRLRNTSDGDLPQTGDAKSIRRARLTRSVASVKHLPRLPFELWNMLLGFLKHDALSVLVDDWEDAEDSSSDPEEGEDEDEDEDDGEDECVFGRHGREDRCCCCTNGNRCISWR